MKMQQPSDHRTDAAPGFLRPLSSVLRLLACATLLIAPQLARAQADCDRKNFRMAVDVGHTARAPGARSARGLYEYAFNLRLASLIERKLHDAGFGKATLLVTADRRYYRGLFGRVQRASGLHADLFLSIHHDSVPDRLLEKWEYNGRKEYYSDRFKGHSIFISKLNGDVAGSLAFAKALGTELKERGLAYTPHYTLRLMGSRRRELLDPETGVYRYDALIVLRETRMPAVLLEAGSIANRDEELELGKPERQGLISDAAVAAVEKFCAARATRTARAPARSAAVGSRP
jgi:N-acetylmuramoyl-L-alanine amidase